MGYASCSCASLKVDSRQRASSWVPRFAPFRLPPGFVSLAKTSTAGLKMPSEAKCLTASSVSNAIISGPKPAICVAGSASALPGGGTSASITAPFCEALSILPFSLKVWPSAPAYCFVRTALCTKSICPENRRREVFVVL